MLIFPRVLFPETRRLRVHNICSLCDVVVTGRSYNLRLMLGLGSELNQNLVEAEINPRDSCHQLQFIFLKLYS